MRVTNMLMADTVSNNFFKNTERLLKIQNMIASQKRINKPSDDPLGAGNVLDFRTTLSSISQYQENISFGKSWLGVTETTLGNIDDLLVRAKEVAVYQATETASSDTRAIAAVEIKNIYINC